MARDDRSLGEDVIHEDEAALCQISHLLRPGGRASLTTSPGQDRAHERGREQDAEDDPAPGRIARRSCWLDRLLLSGLLCFDRGCLRLEGGHAGGRLGFRRSCLNRSRPIGAVSIGAVSISAVVTSAASVAVKADCGVWPVAAASALPVPAPAMPRPTPATAASASRETRAGSRGIADTITVTTRWASADYALEAAPGVAIAGLDVRTRTITLLKLLLPLALAKEKALFAGLSLSGGGGNRTRVRGRTGKSIYKRSPGFRFARRSVPRRHTRRASHPRVSRRGRLALPWRRARRWRRIPGLGPSRVRRRQS